MSKWISISEAWPKENEQVLVCGRWGTSGYTVAVKSLDEWKGYPFGHNLWTHWMPLPQPPNSSSGPQMPDQYERWEREK